jgi:hypothetical protein
VRLRFDGAAKGAIEKVEIDIASVLIAGRAIAAERLTQTDDGVCCAPIWAVPVLIGASDRLWLTLGAISPDRCPIDRDAWRFEEVESHWDRMTLRSFTHRDGNRSIHQEGPLALFGSPRELIARWTGKKRLDSGVALFLGPLPTASTAQPGSPVEIALEDPMLQRTLTHGFNLQTRPLVP